MTPQQHDSAMTCVNCLDATASAWTIVASHNYPATCIHDCLDGGDDIHQRCSDYPHHLTDNDDDTSTTLPPPLSCLIHWWLAHCPPPPCTLHLTCHLPVPHPSPSLAHFTPSPSPSMLPPQARWCVAQSTLPTPLQLFSSLLHCCACVYVDTLCWVSLELICFVCTQPHPLHFTHHDLVPCLSPTRASCHDRVTVRDSARPLVCYRLKSDRDWTPPTLRIHLCSDS